MVKKVLFLSLVFLISCKDVDFYKTIKTREKLADGYKICMIGDSGTGSDEQYLVAEYLKNEQCDQVRILGDIIYPDGIESADDPNLLERFVDPYSSIFEDDNIPFYIAVGNHDYRLNPSAWIDVANNYNNVIFPSLFFMDNHEDICIITLDTNSNRSVQKKWLNALKEEYESSCKLSITVGHHPYKSVGKHGGATLFWKRFFKKYVAGKHDAYFAGHDHNLSHEGFEKETMLIVSGAAAKLRPLKKDPVVWAKSVYGYSIVTIVRDEEKVGFQLSFREIVDAEESIVHDGFPVHWGQGLR